MGKISLNKRIEATKLHERTGAPLAGPEVTIPFGALVESAGTDRDRERFRYLGELYSVKQDIFVAATKGDGPEDVPAAAPAPAQATAPAAPAPAPAAVGVTTGAAPARLRFEALEAGAYAVARAKVAGGWLVTYGSGITYYPDPEHLWDGTSAE